MNEESNSYHFVHSLHLNRRQLLSAGLVVTASAVTDAVLGISIPASKRVIMSRGSDDKPSIHPWIIIKNSNQDDGSRKDKSTEGSKLGPDCVNVWFEDYQPDAPTPNTAGQVIVGGAYQVAVRVDNYGTSPSFGLCIDFFQWDHDGEINGKPTHIYVSV